MRVLLALLIIVASADALAATRIDASSLQRFNETIQQMKRELPADKAKELDAALALLPFAGMNSFKDTPPDGIVRLDWKRLDGMTANQIISLARKTVTVRIRVGAPPGLPQRFKAPLRIDTDHASASSLAPSLVGSRWDLTSNINGFVSHEHVILRADGQLDDGTSRGSHWEIAGTAVRLAFNGEYAVYLGTIQGMGFMQGSAANIDGIEWTWRARRTDLH